MGLNEWLYPIDFVDMPCIFSARYCSLRYQAELSLQREGQRVPNITHPAVPIGGEDLATVIALIGEQRTFEGFEPRDHVTVAESLDLVDFEAAAEVTPTTVLDS